MSKRGSPYLIKALFQAAFIACYHDPVFSAYYQQKVAVGAVVRKFHHTIYAVLKNNVPYKVKR